MGEEANEYEFLRIGTASEKDGVEKELAELKERLGEVEGWKKRKAEVERELGRVWAVADHAEGGGEMDRVETKTEEVEEGISPTNTSGSGL